MNPNQGYDILLFNIVSSKDVLFFVVAPDNKTYGNQVGKTLRQCYARLKQCCAEVDHHHLAHLLDHHWTAGGRYTCTSPANHPISPGPKNIAHFLATHVALWPDAIFYVSADRFVAMGMHVTRRSLKHLQEDRRHAAVFAHGLERGEMHVMFTTDVDWTAGNEVDKSIAFGYMADVNLGGACISGFQHGIPLLEHTMTSRLTVMENKDKDDPHNKDKRSTVLLRAFEVRRDEALPSSLRLPVTLSSVSAVQWASHLPLIYTQDIETTRFVMHLILSDYAGEDAKTNPSFRQCQCPDDDRLVQFLRTTTLPTTESFLMRLGDAELLPAPTVHRTKRVRGSGILTVLQQGSLTTFLVSPTNSYAVPCPWLSILQNRLGWLSVMYPVMARFPSSCMHHTCNFIFVRDQRGWKQLMNPFLQRFTSLPDDIIDMVTNLLDGWGYVSCNDPIHLLMLEEKNTSPFVK